MQSAYPDSRFDYRAAFVGPQGENADEFERLILEVLRDHMMWRRNFHPEDPRLIAEWARSERPYRETAARLRDSLYAVLARLKRGTPLHSPRQLAHMVTDPALPALVGYFAGLLYNQNNVVQEASPETVRCEQEFMAALARMVGYPDLVGEFADPGDSRPRSFGHLTSGGTSANMEVLWTARNVRFFPLAVRLVLAEQKPVGALGVGDIDIERQDGRSGRLRDATTEDLFALAVPEIVRLKREIGQLLHQSPGDLADTFRESLPTVRRVGMGGFLERYGAAFPRDPAPRPVVFASVAAHYCWKKAMDLTGLGSQNLIRMPADERVRLDPDALRSGLQSTGEPVLMVVSICGTTETASVDPVGLVNSIRDAPDVPPFWHHCDGAFGGYFASLVERTDAGPVPRDDLPGNHPSRAVSEDVLRALVGIGATDSVVLDPHKLGFMPYPSGAVLYREYSVRDAIAYDAPYLAGNAESGFGGFLGRWTLEGSRPGAAAVAGYLGQAVVPLEPSGHGRMLANCLTAHRTIFRELQGGSGRNGIQFVPFGIEPDTTGSCFVLAPEGAVGSLAELNELTRRVWEAFTVDESGWNVRRNDFLLSKSEVALRDYPRALGRMFPGDPLPGVDAGGNDRLLLLRFMTVNPYLLELTSDPGPERFAEGLSRRLYEVAGRLASEVA